MLSTMMSSHGFSRNHLSTLKDQRVETTCHRHRTPARYLEDNSITFNTVLQLPYSEPNGCRLSPFSQPNQHRNYAKISRTPLKTTVFFSFAFFGYAFQNDLLAWVKGRSTKWREMWGLTCDIWSSTAWNWRGCLLCAPHPPLLLVRADIEYQSLAKFVVGKIFSPRPWNTKIH